MSLNPYVWYYYLSTFINICMFSRLVIWRVNSLCKLNTIFYCLAFIFLYCSMSSWALAMSCFMADLRRRWRVSWQGSTLLLSTTSCRLSRQDLETYNFHRTGLGSICISFLLLINELWWKLNHRLMFLPRWNGLLTDGIYFGGSVRWVYGNLSHDLLWIWVTYFLVCWFIFSAKHMRVAYSNSCLQEVGAARFHMFSLASVLPPRKGSVHHYGGDLV